MKKDKNEKHHVHEKKSKRYSDRKNKPAKSTILKKKIIFLSDSDRVTRCYEQIAKTREIIKVVNVSYEINLRGEWVTIIRFDSDHGYLHRHTRISFKNKATIVDQNNLVVRGTAKHWLRWAIKHLNNEYLIYKNKFLKRCNLSDE